MWEKIYNLITIATISLIFLSCTDQNNKEIKPIFDDPILVTENSPLGEISLELIGSIGSDDVQMENYIFGIPSSLQTDKVGNLYVLDRSFKNIRVFDPEGKYLRGYKLPKGQGPGEFIRPVSMALSWDGNRIYVSDSVLRRITILDLQFKYVNEIPINHNFFQVFGGPNNTIITVFGQMYLRLNDFIIHVFSEAGDELVQYSPPHKEMVKLRDVKNLQYVILASYAQTKSVNFLALGYPFDIRIHEFDGTLKNRFTHKISFFEDVFTEKEFLFPTGTISGLAVTENSLIIIFVRNNKNEETFLHAFDYDGRSRGVINMSDLKIYKLPVGFNCETFGNNILYICSIEPFPIIFKFKINYLSKPYNK